VAGLLGTVIRLFVALAVIVVLVTVPLLLLHRSRCREHGRAATRWTLVLPGKSAKRRGCRKTETGADVLLKSVGLR
jgi:hypothetical protein